MKKLLAITLVLVFSFALAAGCASDSGTPATPEATPEPTVAPPENTPAPTPEPTPESTPTPEDKEFSAGGLTITLTEHFSNATAEYSDFLAAYKSDSDSALVTIQRDTYNALGAAGLSSLVSLKEYAQHVVDAGGYNCRVEDVGELTHFIYDEGDDSVYSVVYRSEDAYWTIRFYTPVSNYLRLQERFKTWALSIDVGEGPGISNLPPEDLDAYKVFYYDTYGDISSQPSIMWGDKGWSGWVRHDLELQDDGWYVFTLVTSDIPSAYNMLIFYNGLPDSDPDAIQWVWHIDRGGPNGHYFVADMANPENPPSNNFQGWQRDCNSYATLDEANEAVAGLVG